jgi:AcrR family transcriptional regulator
MKAARDERVRPATLREEQKLFTKRLFVETAKRVFAERGYGAATVEDIVKAARAAPRSMRTSPARPK